MPAPLDPGRIRKVSTPYNRTRAEPAHPAFIQQTLHFSFTLSIQKSIFILYPIYTNNIFLTHGQEKGPANMHNPHILQRIV